MFRKMRRFKQELSESECLDILDKNTSGVLALLGDDEYPYALPISYVRDGKKIIFHSAIEGHKIDAVKKHSKASFCVIDQDDIVPEKYTTDYRSTIVFGTVKIIDGDMLKREALSLLAEKYRPGFEDERRTEILGVLKETCVLIFDIEYISGKKAKKQV